MKIDMSGLDARINETKITVMCDVTNPLCGENGATWTFGAQKGATPEIQERLEAGMRHYRDIIISQFGINPDDISGAGAAGGRAFREVVAVDPLAGDADEKGAGNGLAAVRCYGGDGNVAEALRQGGVRGPGRAVQTQAHWFTFM